MQQFKALQPVQVLSFDLDNTLYDNGPVLAAAEHAMLQRLQQLSHVTADTDSDFWWQQRKQLAKQEPEIRHNVGLWRKKGLEQGLLQLGITHNEIPEIAQQAFDAFLQQRCRITIMPSIKNLLQQLASDYTLIAITNGNAQLEPMGISEQFALYLRAGPDGRMKPYPDLFLNAATQLNTSPQHILHIGDSHRADVMGALNAGFQAAWLDHHNQPISVLPHIRLTNVQQLQALKQN